MTTPLPPVTVRDLVKQSTQAIANVEAHRQAMQKVAAEIAAKANPPPPPEEMTQ